MLELLLYTTLSCQEADALMFRIKAHDGLPPRVKIELVETIKGTAPECEFYWDAND